MRRVFSVLAERAPALSIAAGLALLVAAAWMVNEVLGVAATGAALVLAGADVRWPR